MHAHVAHVQELFDLSSAFMYHSLHSAMIPLDVCCFPQDLSSTFYKSVHCFISRLQPYQIARSTVFRINILRNEARTLVVVAADLKNIGVLLLAHYQDKSRMYFSWGRSVQVRKRRFTPYSCFMHDCDTWVMFKTHDFA